MQNLSMGEAAIGMHEIYLSFLNAGFTPEQAFDLLKIIVTLQYGQGSGG